MDMHSEGLRKMNLRNYADKVIRKDLEVKPLFAQRYCKNRGRVVQLPTHRIMFWLSWTSILFSLVHPVIIFLPKRGDLGRISLVDFFEWALFVLSWLDSARLESTGGACAKEWINWEKQLRDILVENAEYLKSIQVPFELAVEQVLEQLRTVAKGEYIAPFTEKRKLGTIVFVAVDLPVVEIYELLQNLGTRDPKVEASFREKNMMGSLTKAHVTLAHKRSHGVTAVAGYGPFLHQKVPTK